jgi:hypothetical protein
MTTIRPIWSPCWSNLGSLFRLESSANLQRYVCEACGPDNTQINIEDQKMDNTW